jgi:AraC-like DNA-binding protein
LTIRHTHVYRLRDVRSVSIAHLDPDVHELFLLGSLGPAVEVASADEKIEIRPGELAVVRDPNVKITATNPTDIVLAVSQSTVIRDMGLIAAVGPVVTRIPVNALLATTLNGALVQAFDLVDADGRELDPRVVDFLHLMARGLIQLPYDPRAANERDVSITERARILITVSHTSRRTSPTTIADALGVPLRSLQRAFALEGSSLARELRWARAQTANALLTAGSSAASGLSGIARDAGFGSTASMRRALHELSAQTEANDPVLPAR